MPVGGIVWGAAAEGFGTRAPLLAVGGLFVASLALARRWSLDPLDLPAPPAPRWTPADAESVRVDSCRTQPRDRFERNPRRELCDQISTHAMGGVGVARELAPECWL